MDLNLVYVNVEPYKFIALLDSLQRIHLNGSDSSKLKCKT